MLISQFKPKFNNAETKKPFHEFSFKPFSSALDTFLGKTSCLFFPHLSNLAVRNEVTELFLAYAQDIVGIIAILFFVVHVFDRN